MARFTALEAIKDKLTRPRSKLPWGRDPTWDEEQPLAAQRTGFL